MLFWISITLKKNNNNCLCFDLLFSSSEMFPYFSFTIFAYLPRGKWPRADGVGELILSLNKTMPFLCRVQG